MFVISSVLKKHYLQLFEKKNIDYFYEIFLTLQLKKNARKFLKYSKNRNLIFVHHL